MKVYKKGKTRRIPLYVNDKQLTKAEKILNNVSKMKKQGFIESESEYLLNLLITGYNIKELEGEIPLTQSSLDELNNGERKSEQIRHYFGLPYINEFNKHGINGEKDIVKLFEHFSKIDGGMDIYCDIIMGSESIHRQYRYNDSLQDKVRQHHNRHHK